MQMPARPPKARIATGAVAAVGLAGVLAGCTYVDRTAVRLNSDGTLDVAICESVGTVGTLKMKFYIRTKDDSEIFARPDPLPTTIEPGTLMHFDDVPPDGTWDRLYFSMEGSEEFQVNGLFDKRSLRQDEWL